MWVSGELEAAVEDFQILICGIIIKQANIIEFNFFNKTLSIDRVKK